MKKLLAILVLGLLLASCATNDEGEFTMGPEGSILWHASASHAQLVQYYSERGVDEICHQWKYFEEISSEDIRVRNRNAMKEVLVNKKVDPLICMKLPST